MKNEVWDEIAEFLKGLRCGNVNRTTYLQFTECKEAKSRQRNKQRECYQILNELPEIKKNVIETYLETMEEAAFENANEAYCQGFVDCIQLLAGLGIMKSSPQIKEIIEKIINK